MGGRAQGSHGRTKERGLRRNHACLTRNQGTLSQTSGLQNCERIYLSVLYEPPNLCFVMAAQQTNTEGNFINLIRNTCKKNPTAN